uniref:protein ACCELERATED CELL DEATH 6-like n=1 Tax=Erigeron canadensis TaxID=72917 RepID=UPI001CB8F460|nr:protein ACCELERATED CELL DEATH 6-like [Erigeron canadensis]
MATHLDITDHKSNAVLYQALSDRDEAVVIDKCKGFPDGPLHVVTIHGDTVLHLAIWYKYAGLVLKLIGSLSEDQYNKLTLTNASGNTLLHATATNDKSVRVAEAILLRAPSLLTMTNRFGETALFRAARYGKKEIYCFLSNEISSRRFPDELLFFRTFLQRDDKATIFHVAIHSENFDLAHHIIDKYPSLINKEDKDGMTGLQLLANKPLVFDSDSRDNFVKWLIYKLADSHPKGRTSRVPILKEIQKRKLKSELAKNLASFLIDKDVSWEATGPLSDHSTFRVHNFRGDASTVQQTRHSPVSQEISHSTLFLATESGCTEIVRKILEVYPQAIEQIDEDGCTILHVAIKYRRMEIYETVTNMKSTLTRIREKIDKQGNSILHMVGHKVRDQKAEGDIRSPALILREDLLLFESVSKACTRLGRLQINADGKTGEQLFNEKNEQLRMDAKQWMRSTAEHCTIVAVLIATVAFAAAYTVPGGPNQQTGYPLLKNKPYFIIFALADALSLTFSLTSVILFLSILTSSFRLWDFKSHLHNKLLLGLTMLILSVSMMMVAFAATLILTISSAQHWTNIILYTISFLPVSVFLLSYVRLYIRLIKALATTICKNIALLLPVRDIEISLANQDTGLPSHDFV